VGAVLDVGLRRPELGRFRTIAPVEKRIEFALVSSADTIIAPQQGTTPGLFAPVAVSMGVI
jgi:hypothetical protein